MTVNRNYLTAEDITDRLVRRIHSRLRKGFHDTPTLNLHYVGDQGGVWYGIGESSILPPMFGNGRLVSTWWRFRLPNVEDVPHVVELVRQVAKTQGMDFDETVYPQPGKQITAD